MWRHRALKSSSHNPHGQVAAALAQGKTSKTPGRHSAVVWGNFREGTLVCEVRAAGVPQGKITTDLFALRSDDKAAEFKLRHSGGGLERLHGHGAREPNATT